MKPTSKMKTINAEVDEFAFGIDTDGKLKLQMDVTYEGDELPVPIQIILAFQSLARVAKENGMCKKELFTIAMRDENHE